MSGSSFSVSGVKPLFGLERIEYLAKKAWEEQTGLKAEDHFPRNRISGALKSEQASDRSNVIADGSRQKTS